MRRTALTLRKQPLPFPQQQQQGLTNRMAGLPRRQKRAFPLTVQRLGETARTAVARPAVQLLRSAIPGRQVGST